MKKLAVSALVALAVALLLLIPIRCSRSVAPSLPSAAGPAPPPETAKPTVREYRLERALIPAKVADDALSTLVPGRIVYNPPAEMRVGDTLPIQVRIASATAPISSLTNGLIRAPSAPPEGIRISRTMKVLLTGAPDDFKIDLQSPEEQIVEDDSSTEWLFMVKPLRAGNRTLYLSAIAVVRIGGVEKVKEFPVHSAQIHVKVNPIGFVTDHWQQISGAVTGTGLLGWLAARFKRRRKLKKKRASP